MNSISSSQNDHYKRWKSLLQSKGIKKHQQFILSGRKILNEHLSNDYIKELLIDEKDITSLSQYGKGLTVYSLSSSLFKELDTFNTGMPLLIGETPQLTPYETNLEQPGLHIFCAFTDPSNLGGFIRTSIALNAQTITLLREAAHPYLPKALRASSGSILSVKLYQGPSIHDLIGDFHALDLDGESIINYQWPKQVKLIIGEEGQGVPAHLSVKKINIPQSDKVESLNAMVAGSIAIYDFFSKNKA